MGGDICSMNRRWSWVKMLAALFSHTCTGLTASVYPQSGSSGVSVAIWPG